ncbi:MAG: hypothetical protein CME65_06580 [Halobacteriovoraceae bacterium]|nr:hypothetical protein [Halobacteriovoraceae bacterium]|tara:strand:+ start:18931 stop:19734 length:804 start_codon:yes stop_codon:yes gene_type:complete
MEQIFVLIGIALILGFVSSFLGIGGGSIAVPVLYAAFPESSPIEVIAISLGSIFLIANLNLIQFSKHKVLPSKNQIPLMAFACLVGGLIGSEIITGIDPLLMKKIFGVILILLALKASLQKKKDLGEKRNESVPNRQMLVISFSGALLSSLTGLGGGIIFTPAFLEVSKLKIQKVAPYSNLAMVFATGFGVAPHLLSIPIRPPGISIPYLDFLQIGYLNVSVVVFLALGSLLSSPLGVKYNQRVSPERKRQILIAILAILALKTLLS